MTGAPAAVSSVRQEQALRQERRRKGGSGAHPGERARRAQSRRRAPVGAPPPHVAHPRLRGAGARGLAGEARARGDPSFDRPGGGRGGRLRQPRPRRRAALDPSRARPHPRQGRRPARHDARAVRPRGRQLRRQGRLDAHRRFQGRHARRERRRRGEHRDRGGRRARHQAEAREEDRLLHLRRRRDQPRAVPRGAELGEGLRPAGAVRVRGQRLCRDDADEVDDRRRRPLGARSQRSGSPPRRSTATTCSRSILPRARRSAPCARTAARASSTSTPIASPATPAPTPRPTARRRRSSSAGATTRSPARRRSSKAPAQRATRSRPIATRPSRKCAQAYEAAKATPYPPVEHAFADVQDVGDPRREAF